MNKTQEDKGNTEIFLSVLGTKENSENGDIKKKPMPLEEALAVTGYGKFHYLLMLTVGLILCEGLGTLLVMSYVIPAVYCDLNLNSTQKGTLNSIIFIGMICTSHLIGFLSDRYGRRSVVIRCLFMCGVFSILASLSANYEMLVLTWFANGIMLSGIVTPIYVYLSEFMCAQRRVEALLVAAGISSLAPVYMPSVAWLILPLKFEFDFFGLFMFTSWRLFVAFNALPCFVYVLFLSYFPESPKYLLCKGKKKRTLDVLRRIYKTNRRNEENGNKFTVTDVCMDQNDSREHTDTSTNTFSGFIRSMWHQTKLLFTPPLLTRTILSCIMQFGIIGCYNIVILWLPEFVNRMSKYSGLHPEYDVTLCQVLSRSEPAANLTGTTAGASRCAAQINTNVYITNFTAGLLLVACFVFSSKLSNWVGRRILIVACVAIPAACCFLVTMVTQMVWTIIFLGTVVVMLGVAIPVSLNIIVDLYPTHIRSMAACIAMVCGRIGAAGGSQVFGYLQETHCSLTYYIVAVCMIGVAAVCGIISRIK